MDEPLRVYETVLYAADVDRTEAFYRSVLGLGAVTPPDAHSAALRLGDGSVLLIFDPARSALAGRTVPSHGATGAGHVALRVPDGQLEQWLARLRRLGVALEQDQRWPGGGRSLYVRDPAGNSVELVEGEIWTDR